MVKDTKAVFNPAIAKKLVQMGFKIVDLKEHRENKIRTIFIFEYSKELENELIQYSKFIKK